jgi:hypothetical protein
MKILCVGRNRPLRTRTCKDEEEEEENKNICQPLKKKISL